MLSAIALFLANSELQTMLELVYIFKIIVVDVLQGNVVTVSVLSGNRNTEGRVQLATQANYLASPLLVIAYALAGTVAIDLDKEPIGVNHDGKSIFLRDIWPSAEDIQVCICHGPCTVTVDPVLGLVSYTNV